MKKYIPYFLSIIAVFLIIPNIASAQSADQLLWGGYQATVESDTGLGSLDPRVMVASLIQVVLGFIGIIAVAIIMMAGFKWMTSGGNEDKIGESKRMLSGAVIGIILMLASYGIANFVINSLYGATTGVL